MVSYKRCLSNILKKTKKTTHAMVTDSQKHIKIIFIQLIKQVSPNHKRFQSVILAENFMWEVG